MDAHLMELHNSMMSSVTGLSLHQLSKNVRKEARKVNGKSKHMYRYYQALVYNKQVFSD